MQRMKKGQCGYELLDMLRWWIGAVEKEGERWSIDEDLRSG